MVYVYCSELFISPAGCVSVSLFLARHTQSDVWPYATTRVHAPRRVVLHAGIVRIRERSRLLLMRVLCCAATGRIGLVGVELMQLLMHLVVLSNQMARRVLGMLVLGILLQLHVPLHCF